MVTKDEFLSNIESYVQVLKYEEKSENTISKYRLGIRTFINYAESKSWDHAVKDSMLEYKKHLEDKYELSTANLYIIALSSFMKFIHKESLCLKTLKIQEQKTNLENSFTMDEYSKMSYIAKNRKNKDAYYIMLALASTGIRISELQFLTVEALYRKSMNINNKGKTRLLPLSEKLCSVFMEYCKDKEINNGYIFYTKNPQKPIDRRTVSKRIKTIARLAKIDETKAHPHSLRHLFAKRFMEVVGNVTALKNILGHSSLKSTMIYTVTTNDEKRKDMDKLGFY